MTGRSCLTLALLGSMLAVVGCARTPAPPVAPTRPLTTTNAPRVPVQTVPKSPAPTETPTQTASLQILPAALKMLPGDDGAQLIAIEGVQKGGRRDLTRAVAWEVKPEGIVTIDGGGYLRPLAS